MEIGEFERKILERLQSEQEEKEEKLAEHLRDTKAKKDKNIAARKQLKESLTTLNAG